MEGHDEKMKAQKKAYSIRLIGLLSLCHAGVDFLCAFSLYHSFSSFPSVFLIYNFCAFALQMPIGILIDYDVRRRNETFFAPAAVTIAGIFFTIIGAFLSPVITGLGNACFHAGGGVLTIEEDRSSHLKGRGLGVFVAPGAVGLILGILYHDTVWYHRILCAVIVVMLCVACLIISMRKEEKREISIEFPEQTMLKIFLCFAVVLLRSLAGMAISFPWKRNDLITIVSVIALACGKTAGGFIAARFGMKRSILVSLSLAALFYVFADHMIFGLLALFFFNMSMPLTLYLLAQELKRMPGFAFGILTFALFIGYLPVLYGFLYQIPSFPMGSIASIVSIGFLMYFLRLQDDR